MRNDVLYVRFETKQLNKIGRHETSARIRFVWYRGYFILNFVFFHYWSSFECFRYLCVCVFFIVK